MSDNRTQLAKRAGQALWVPALMALALVLGPTGAGAEDPRPAPPSRSDVTPPVRQADSGSRAASRSQSTAPGRTAQPRGEVDSRTRHTAKPPGRRGGHTYHYYPRYRGYYYYPYYYGRWGGLGFYAGYPWWPSTTVIVSPGYPGGAQGALDTDVWPEDTEVWVDGVYYGFVDQFDGWPRHLWLPVGTYDVAFYLPGYETVVRQYTVRPGEKVRIDFDLVPGEAVHPRDLMKDEDEPGPRELARLEREAERRAQAEARRRQQESWREKGPAGEPSGPSAESVAGPASSGDREAGVGRLFLQAVPDGASVYLDGVFLGTAFELQRLSAGVVVAAGSHRLSVVHPGYEEAVEELEVEAGQRLSRRIEMERD